MTVETRDDERAGSCWECGYWLRGLEATRCPECGRPFDPADETTMNFGGETGPLTRGLMRPPAAPLHLLTAAAVAFSLWAAATPRSPWRFVYMLIDLTLKPHTWKWGDLYEVMLTLGLPEGRFLFGLALWLAVVLAWVVRRVARGVTVWRLTHRRAAPWAYWRRWLATPFVLLVTLLVCLTDLPVYAGFWLSKPWLERAAAETAALTNGSIPDRWIGIYPPTGEPMPRAVRGRGETTVLVAPGGAFVHVDQEDPPPADIGNRGTYTWGRPHARHIAGRWYVVGFEND